MQTPLTTGSPHQNRGESRATISIIRDDNGVIRTTPKEVNGVFKEFYTRLYSSEVIHDHDRCKVFLDELNLPLSHKVKGKR